MWVIRLLIIISQGIQQSSLWNTLSNYFTLEDGIARRYIHSLAYLSRGGVYELFITQRHSLEKVLDKTKSGCVVSIPTSSGKTRIAEIAILDTINNDSSAKILFITPYRSLAFEIENSLDEVFENIGITVSHLYGGNLFSKMDERVIDESNVIVATPEKAKALLRGRNSILNEIKLAIIDEGHLLGGDERLIVNEMFYEELRYFINKNKGRFLLLSAVLPNADDLAQWLTGSRDSVFADKWRPSDERLGTLEWNGKSVDLNWISTDSERKSANPGFITSRELPLLARQRKKRFFPGTKYQAVAATAFKLKVFGPVLIFVGNKASVFTIANDYLSSIGDNPKDFVWNNQMNWRTFELACIENYGNDSQWLSFARKGILCHNADLHADVRMPLERLMRQEKPLVVIATSTLGQGVNLGISTVLFSSLYQAGKLISSRDFWNIAGRAGRAFVDHEGKILVCLDASKSSTKKEKEQITYQRSLIKQLFNKQNIDKTQSGLLLIVYILNNIAIQSNVSFDLLLQLVSENKADDIYQNNNSLDNLLDLIDDSLLSLHSIHNDQGSDNREWIDSFFMSSLAGIQAQSSSRINTEQFLGFLKARIRGIITKVGSEPSNWEQTIKSVIPINSDIQINLKIKELIGAAGRFLLTDKSITNKINLLADIEDICDDVNAIARNRIASKDKALIREYWLTGAPMSQIALLDNGTKIISSHYSFNLPWILNGISRKLANLDFLSEAEVLEELSILVEHGLPDIKSVKIYQAGIRSRVSASEIGRIYKDELWDNSIKSYKRDLIFSYKDYEPNLSELANEWIQLLITYSKSSIKYLKIVPPFTFSNAHEITDRLLAKKIKGKQFLVSPDFSFISEVSGSKIDFSQVSDVNGIYFDYDSFEKAWLLINNNPHIRFR